MHRSHWDLEVYAKDFQERRQQEAARGRLGAEAAAAQAGIAVGGNPVKLAMASILGAWKALRVSGRVAGPPHPAGAFDPIAAVEVASRPHRPARGRLAQPYADMVVIARGPMAAVTEQPSGVSDC
jgi:hypothetical protein